MLTYEEICSRNRELHEALEVLTSQLLSDQPEGEDREMIRKRMEAIKGEIDVNLDRLELMLTRASDYLPPTPKPGSHTRVVCVDTGEEYPCIHDAACTVGLDGHALKNMLLGKRTNWTSLIIPGAKKEIKYY